MRQKSMPKALEGMPEVFVSDTGISRSVSRAVKNGQLRKLAPRLYTSNLDDSAEALVRRNLWGIAAGYFPGSIIADRTALESAPAHDGSVCLVASAGRSIQLPGYVLRPRRGVAPLPTDRPFLEGLFMSSTARAYLENMQASRARGGRAARTLPRRQIEERLETLLRRSGDDAVIRLRREIHVAASALGMPSEAAVLDAIIGALLGTQDSPLKAPSARARSRDRPYDPDRLDLFQALFAALRDHPPRTRPAAVRDSASMAALAFFEVYFSNFIEGTEFTVDEAAAIVFHEAIPGERPQDAHDVRNTWQIVADAREMRRVPKDSKAFIRLAKARHAVLMARRSECRPGAFKEHQNRAGATVFVAPELVVGTLRQGFGYYRGLETPFQRAVFIKFLLSEVHPFVDGNGRMARIMMNAELVSAGEERIVIPTAYRDDYLSALRALSHSGRPEPLIQMLDYAQRWTAAIAWSSVDDACQELEQCNALLDPRTADETGRRLRMPGTLREPRAD